MQIGGVQLLYDLPCANWKYAIYLDQQVLKGYQWQILYVIKSAKMTLRVQAYANQHTHVYHPILTKTVLCIAHL